jgi:hypothetical protein
MVIFAPQNVIMDPPFTKLDLLTCRNLLIYLDAGLQKKLLPLFHYSLNPGGVLMLGTAETIGERQRPVCGVARQEPALSPPGAARAPGWWSFPPSFPAWCDGRKRRKPACRERTGPRAANLDAACRRDRACCWPVSPQRRCWSPPRATSSTSAARPASISNRPPARSTGTCSPWPARVSLRAERCLLPRHARAHGGDLKDSASVPTGAASTSTSRCSH